MTRLESKPRRTDPDAFCVALAKIKDRNRVSSIPVPRCDLQCIAALRLTGSLHTTPGDVSSTYLYACSRVCQRSQTVKPALCRSRVMQDTMTGVESGSLRQDMWTHLHASTKPQCGHGLLPCPPMSSSPSLEGNVVEGLVIRFVRDLERRVTRFGRMLKRLGNVGHERTDDVDRRGHTLKAVCGINHAHLTVFDPASVASRADILLAFQFTQRFRAVSQSQWHCIACARPGLGTFASTQQVVVKECLTHKVLICKNARCEKNIGTLFAVRGPRWLRDSLPKPPDGHRPQDTCNWHATCCDK